MFELYLFKSATLEDKRPNDAIKYFNEGNTEFGSLTLGMLSFVGVMSYIWTKASIKPTLNENQQNQMTGFLKSYIICLLYFSVFDRNEEL